MEVKAKAKYIRTSPRKARLVVDVIRGLSVQDALSQLRTVNKWAVRPIEKLVKSAIANAEHNYELEASNLYIKEIRVDEGPTLKRWMPRAFGRATPIRKRTSHIFVVLAEIIESERKEAKKSKVDEPVKLSSKPKQEEGITAKKEVESKKEAKTGEEGVQEGRIHDPREEGKGKHAKIEGKSFKKGFAGKVFRRKSG